MRQATLLSFCWLLGVPSAALAQDVNLLEEGGIRGVRAPNISTELLDPTARTRFHLTTRFTFTDDRKTFSDSALTTFEANAVVRIIEGLGISFGLPFGLDAPKPGNDQLFLGNIHIGVEGGTVILFNPKKTDDPAAPRLGVGGAFDLYAPTARGFENRDEEADRIALVRDICSYDPELFLERTAAFGFRGHADFSISIVTAELELGLTPAVTADEAADFLMLLGWAGRIAVRPIDALEPFLEVGSSVQIAGDPLHGHDLDTPVRLTLGLRGHFGLDPALFVSIDLGRGGVLFGIDIAAAFRTESRERSLRDPLDFDAAR